jgi:1-deoxy-D-xylulose-5-phosphate synthase
VKPLDEELISELAGRCGRVVTIEENAVAGGFGSAVEEMLQRRGITVPVLSLGLPDRFIEHGRREQLLAEIGLEPGAIAHAIEQFIASTTHSLAR